MPGISIKTTISEKELPKFKTESDLRGCAITGNNGGTVQATVDGKNLQNLDRYRVQSPLFNVTFADHNIFGAPAGITQAVSDGWWVFLQPLALLESMKYTLAECLWLTQRLLHKVTLLA